MWLNLFDDRQKKEINFCKIYARSFAHGTDGHNSKMIIAKLTEILDEIRHAMAPVNHQDNEIALVQIKQIQRILGFDQVKDDNRPK